MNDFPLFTVDKVSGTFKPLSQGQVSSGSNNTGVNPSTDPVFALKLTFWLCLGRYCNSMFHGLNEAKFSLSQALDETYFTCFEELWMSRPVQTRSN